MYVPIDDISHTGVLWKDSLPLTTMVFCFLPLYATFRKGLPFQSFWASCSCLTATVYHYCLFEGMEGGAAGFTMDDLRSFDVIIACYCLGISLAYLLHSNHPLVLLSVRVVAPISMVAMYTQGAQLFAFAKVLIANTVFIFVGRVVLPSPAEVPVYDFSYLKFAVPCTLLGLLFFPLPVYMPHMYWLYHSLWHVFIGLALFTCYGFLHTGQYQTVKQKRR